VSKEVSDSRGVGYVLRFGSQEVLVFEIKAGKLRGGEIHSGPQYSVCVYGSIEVVLKQNGKCNVSLLSAGSVIIIPKNTPHLFRALEDSVFVEWKKPGVETEYYDPFRRIVEEQFK
jgi:quercetin dioxygenase-like cupin family protein